ncbi:hypothetical protein INT48_006634 [Thamnidium elegans]|uniref:Sterol regulatory element-binding protein cleavage-activating protein n=1 Tax=Thamnidium elegans TaxID=101142 RepID=A0A8H7VXS2_9FUNG|nr:hypothetical protein INT48_006634 [Thamnidium elegans]
MPYRTVARLSKRLSNYYYDYGKTVASRINLLLLFSLSFIFYFSLPYLTKSVPTAVTPTTHNNIPLSQISTSLDAQCWHASAHVQFNNFTQNSRLFPSQYLITERIRLSHPDQPVTFELIQQAKEIYESLTTMIVMEQDSAVSLSSICYKHQGHCLVHAPPFELLQDESDWRKNTNLNSQTPLKYKSHPYSIYSNTTFNQLGEFIKADAVLLTFVLKQSANGNTVRIWNNILQQVKSKYNIIDHHQFSLPESSIWYGSTNTSPQMIQYKFNLFPYEVSNKVQLSIVAYIIVFYLVSTAFGKSNLVKSGYTFGLATVFLSTACFTTTWGIFIKLGISLNNVPWYLLLISVNIASLENVFLLTNAVLNAGCDMIVIEKVSRGLQSVGVPMTATLAAELIILTLGGYMDNALIKEFCMFTKVALCVDYILEMTFIIAVLSIDIKRVELADLDDRQMSKRLHEIANRDTEAIQQNPDFCPVQDNPNEQDSKSCADSSQYQQQHQQVDKYKAHQPELNQLSDQFWTTVNPEQDITWLKIQPPHLFIYDDDINRVTDHLEQLQELYLAKSMLVRAKMQRRPSLFRMFILTSLQNTLLFVSQINIPMLMLCFVTIGIITWMTPKWRDQWLLPILTHTFNQFFLGLIHWFPLQFMKRVYYFYLKGQWGKEYDGDGVHRGAISVQNIFNQQQYRANVKHVQVRTLTSQHVADIQNLDANAKHSLVSCGQDGRLVLWNADVLKSTWVARLDKLSPIRGGVMQATLNADFFQQKKKKVSSVPRKSTQKKKSSRTQQVVKTILPKARCVKVDQGNKWIAAGYDDGMVRIWNISTGTLVREMEYQPHLPSVEIQDPETPKLRNRVHGTVKQKSHVASDRILFIQFIGIITEYCHPLVAEAAARVGSSEIEASQNFIISVHKSGFIYEWDILSGECIQTVKTGHLKEITQLHVVDIKAPYRKLGITWVFTASKDGTVKCWERRLIQSKDSEQEEVTTTGWKLAYTIEQNSPITSIATELPVGGMGVVVTGCSDGSVRVWNFETGECVGTLSLGKSSMPSTSIDNLLVGGPIRKFSKFSSGLAEQQSSDDEASDTASVYSRHEANVTADHRGSIYQVAVTRYCEVENGPGLCRSCDTCFGNGFLIASSSMDGKVHAWRLERSDGGHEGSCTLCTKDYHRKQYKHRKSEDSSDSGRQTLTASGRRRRSSVQVKKRAAPTRPVMTDVSMLELLDIEQLAGDVHIPLKATFLGKVDQPAGRGVVFCDKILAGVRRRRASSKGSGEWETWFASLQYYDPSKEDDGAMRIPIETFDLDDDTSAQLDLQKEEEIQTFTLRDTLLGLFTSAPAGSAVGGNEKKTLEHQLKYKRIHEGSDGEYDDDEADEDMLEASENLPFSTVRHIIPLDGCALACDFGNFIKLVYLDKPSLTEKEKLKQASDSIDTRPLHKKKIVEQVIEEDEGVDSGCQCDEEENSGCATKDDCCGGANKEKNGGKCCGGNVKKQQDEKRRQKALLKKKSVENASFNGCSGARSIADCSLRNNCSKASDCMSSTSVVPSPYSFNNWL